MVLLEAASPTAPPGLESMLRELGDGEAGFGGTSFGRDEKSLAAFLDERVRYSDDHDLPAARVPETTFWIIVDGVAVGMLRMRHHLNEALRVKGGHIGYYIRASARGRGIAKQALALALDELAGHGESQAMLTTDPDNVSSIRVIEANGGSLAGQVPDPDGSELINQYWIDLG